MDNNNAKYDYSHNEKINWLDKLTAQLRLTQLTM